MEAAAAVVSFVGLAGPVAQSLKFLYDFTTEMKDCPKDIREMKTDLELVEDLITQVIRQCNERDVRLRESAALARAISNAQESVQDLKKELTEYLVGGKHKRFRFAAKISQTQKLRASLDRTKTYMFDFKNQLQSDLLYDIRDMNQEVLKSVEKTNKDLEKYDSKVRQVTQQPEGQPKTTHNTQGPVDTSAHPASDTSSEGLTDIKIMAKKLEHITDLLTETRISPSPSSIPSTPSLSRDVSDITLMNSSQETSPSRYSSPRSIQRSVSKNAPQSTPSLARDVSNISGTTSSQETTPSRYSNLRSISRSVSKIAPQENILTKHPLLQFKDNQFHFLIALIFTQRTNKQALACQRASECLAAYPTPEAISNASEEELSQYFGGIGLQNVKPPQMIQLAQAYVKDPPRQGRERSKARCPSSEISHLPRMGLSSVNAYLVYCCERTDVVTDDKTLLEYVEYLKTEKEAGGL